MSFLIRQLRITGAKKFHIADEKVRITASGQSITTPGNMIELKNMEVIITDEEIADVEKKHEVNIIDKLKETNDYKSSFLKITKTEVEEPKKKEKSKKEK